MSTLAGDFWVCGDCRSINNAGARQCYNCRTPRERAAVDPDAIDPSSHGPLRAIELPEFKSSRWVAVLATILIIAVAVMQVVQFNLAAQLVNQILDGTEPTEEQLIYVGSVAIMAFGMALLALIAWALWLSRTVTSMPALGLGYPAANGLMAFVENFIPVLNLYRVPAIVRDVVRRLEPKTGGDDTMTRGEALIFAAWFGLIGGFFIPRVLGFLNRDSAALIPISGIGTGFVLIGAIFLIVLIWWIEDRVAKRRVAQLAEGASGASPTVAMADTPAPDPAVSAAALDAIQTRSAFAAMAGTTTAGVQSFRLPPTEAAATSPMPAPSDEPAAPMAPSPMPTPSEVPFAPMAPSPSVASSEAPAPLEHPLMADAPIEQPPVPVAPSDPAPSPPPEQAVPEPTSPPATAPPMTSPSASPGPPTPAPAPAAATAGPPNLTIRVSGRGLMTAEMDGEVEHLMLDDLGTYATALSHVGGTATIHVPSEDGMPALVAKRAQRILADAGVDVTFA